MTTITKFSPSVNILRDVDNEFNYLPTTNSFFMLSEILKGYKSGGKRSFSIIGAYGTGKSSLLWAIQKTLSKTKNIFQEQLSDINNGIPTFESIALVGVFDSLIDTFANVLEVDNASPTIILKNIESRAEMLAKEGKALIILMDEFGKFLEYAAKVNPERELYFIQQLAELTNDASKNILFVLTLHQNFDAYALGLDQVQRQEWDKVKGRLKELAFNEPVEQLLLLAANRINAQNTADKNFKLLFEAIEEAKIFPLRDYCTLEVATKLYPFDILAAAVLTMSLQKYGQNERSLFSFIEGDEHLGLSYFTKQQKETFFNVSCVYDYIYYNYYNFLHSRYNPNLAQWSAIRTALERLEAISEYTLETLEYAQKLIKTIGLLRIFIPSSAHLNKTFLVKYAKIALQLPKDSVEMLLTDLEKKHKIILYRKYEHKYVLTEGTDLDIQTAIDAAGGAISNHFDIAQAVNKSFNFPYILAKANYYKFGTPRFFEFILTNTPTQAIPQEQVDGYINLIFSENLSAEKLQKHSQACEEATLFGLYQNTEAVRACLWEIEKIKKVKEENIDDKVAFRELNIILEYHQSLLHKIILGNLHTPNSSILWYFQGKKVSFETSAQFHKFLSEIVGIVYHKTPVFGYEMINKTKLSGAMKTARNKLLEALVDKHTEANLGFPEENFPPEKSIYLSLLKKTGIHKNEGNIGNLQAPEGSDLAPLWEICEQLLEQSKNNKLNLKAFYEVLQRRPIKLKSAFVEFWVPIYLFIKRNDYALFDVENDAYIPNLSKDVMDLICKHPFKFSVKAFDLDGVKLNLFNSYRTFLNKTELTLFSNPVFIETIRPFLAFYKELPEYSKKTKRLSTEALALREAIATAKDPEKSFFEDFPTALGFNLSTLQADNQLLATYTQNLQQAIRELRTNFEDLLGRFEAYLLERLGFEQLTFEVYKPQIQARFAQVKAHLLATHQKPFFQRIQSGISDRRAWLLSIAQACLGKQLELMTDVEEPVLFSKLQYLIHELDNLNDISSQNIDEQKEVYYQINVSSLSEGLKNEKDSVRIPKSKTEELDKMALKIKKVLSKDHELNLAVLSQLIQEQINHGKKS